MVKHQLRSRGLRDERVLEAMGRVPREAFVPPEIAHEAYLDCALPIDCNQTISQPIIVAMMTEALQLTGDREGPGNRHRQRLPGRHPRRAGRRRLFHRAARRPGPPGRTRLKQLGYRNVFIRAGDGSLGWPEEAPFDRIIVTAAAQECPPALWDQLIEGGILVGPFGPSSEQALYEMHKIAGQPQSRVLTGCRFVPLVSNERG